MPQISGAPEGMNKIMEAAYSSALKKYPGNKAKASKIAYAAAKNAGYMKGKDGKWMMKKEMSEMIKAKDFVIFRAGHWNGEDYTENDLDQMAANFNAQEPPHIIVGHSSDYKGKSRIPSFGQIFGGLKRVGKDLIASGAEFTKELAGWIKKGYYQKPSIELATGNRILAVGMLGAAPPGVKGLPALDAALDSVAMEYSEDVKVVEFADGTAPAIDLEEVETMSQDALIKNIEEEFATCVSDIEGHLASSDEDEEIKQNCMDALMECYRNVCEEIDEHFTLSDRLDELEPEEVESMMEKIKGWLHIQNKSQSRKDTNEMEAKEKKEYQDKIDALTTQVTEFTEKERLANEAKTAAEQAAAIAAQAAKDESLKAEIKTFCDAAIKDNKMIPAEREKDEPIMFTLAKTSPDALKSFQEKYIVGRVPLGEVKKANEDPIAKVEDGIMKKAETYAVAHAKEKEFSDCRTKEDKTNRAVYLYQMGKIKFE